MYALRAHVNKTCGVREFMTPAHFTLGPKARAEKSSCRGQVLKYQKAYECSRG